MAARNVYVCDWCAVEAKSRDHIDSDWEVRSDPTGKTLHLCGACDKALMTAYEAARKQRAGK